MKMWQLKALIINAITAVPIGHIFEYVLGFHYEDYSVVQINASYVFIAYQLGIFMLILVLPFLLDIFNEAEKECQKCPKINLT